MTTVDPNARLPRCTVCGLHHGSGTHEEWELRHESNGESSGSDKSARALMAEAMPGPTILEAAAEKMEYFARNRGERVPSIVELREWAAMLRQIAAPSAASSAIPEETICAACKGSGEMKGMTQGNGPDDYEVDVQCSKCGGTGVVAASSASTSDRERAAAYILEASKDQLGAGDDPVGFLIASHRLLASKSHASTLVTEAHAAAEVMEFFARNRETVGTRVPSIAELREWAALLRRLAPASAIRTSAPGGCHVCSGEPRECKGTVPNCPYDKAKIHRDDGTEK